MWWNVEAYDRLCHKQDTPFSMSELHTWLDTSGLHQSCKNETFFKESLLKKEFSIAYLDEFLADLVFGFQTDSIHEHPQPKIQSSLGQK